MIAGFSTRSLAESAARTGFEVVSLDYFGDSDQRALVENHSLKRDYGQAYSASTLAEAGRKLRTDALVYTSSLENHPQVVADLAADRLLLGNGPDVLRQVRDWGILRVFCDKAGIATATTLLPGEEGLADPALRWLRKPLRGGGGRDIRAWDGTPLDEHHLLQAHVDGTPASAAFVADGEKALVLGMTEQLIGREELGSEGFAWCGNILPLDLREMEGAALRREIARMTCRLTERFGLKGVNGIDFVVSSDAGRRPKPVLIEVNPRYTASMELMEWAGGISMFSLHVKAAQGLLSIPSDVPRLGPTALSFGKAIVYALSDVTVPDTKKWVDLGRRDVPYPGERIEAGHPVCTVLAEGKGRAGCWLGLLEAARSLRRELGDQIGGIP